MPLLSDREKSILEKGEIIHNKRFFFFRQCFSDYNTYPFIPASVRDRVKKLTPIYCILNMICRTYLECVIVCSY